MRIQDLIPLPIRKSLGASISELNRGFQKSRLLWQLRGDAVRCNVCGWQGSGFADDQWHPGTICPSCRCQVRHRMLVAVLDGGLAAHPEWTEAALIKGRSILHFAPERHFRDRIRAAAGRYVTADYDRGDCDLKLDMSAMPQVDSSSFDLVIACDVLEHVHDDAAAFREIHRILKPGGTAILTVPQRDSPSRTDEDLSVTDPAERFRRFGQHDHVRMYGDDFIDRIRAAGLGVTQVSVADFPPDAVNRLVLHPPKISAHPLATNQRRIYFAARIQTS